MENTEPSILYTCDDISMWRSTLEAYDSVLKLKAKKENKTRKEKDLVALDCWYQNELPKTLSSREKTFLNLEELCQLMKWKLTRGKVRPRLSDLVKTNDENTVENLSCKAFDCLPDVSSAIRELSKLKAIGPATASAILSAGAPDLVPFMADEAMMAIPNMGEINYNLSFYMKFVEKVSKAAEKLKLKDPDGHWTAHKVELALWTEVTAKKLKFPITYTKKTQTTKNQDKTGKKRKALLSQETESQEHKLRRSSRKKA